MMGRTRALLILAVAASGCATRGPARRPAVVFGDDSDIATLGALWRGETQSCTKTASTGQQSCPVAGWQSVTLDQGPAGRHLRASATNPNRCELTRFTRGAPKALDDMEGQIVSTSTVLPDDRLFPQACLTVSVYYDRAACDLFLTPRQAPDDSSTNPGDKAGCPLLGP